MHFKYHFFFFQTENYKQQSYYLFDIIMSEVLSSQKKFLYDLQMGVWFLCVAIYILEQSTVDANFSALLRLAHMSWVT